MGMFGSGAHSVGLSRTFLCFLFVYKCVCVCVCMCMHVCVCVYVRDRETERQTEMQRERERYERVGSLLFCGIRGSNSVMRSCTLPTKLPSNPSIYSLRLGLIELKLA